MTTAVARLRALLAEPDKIVVAPGVYDGFTARIALGVGFDAIYMTGAGTTMSRLGQPDLGIATLNDMRDNASMIANLDRTIPLIADADTGYGGPVMVGRTVTQYITAGIAALHLEDQVVNKRCGHLRNKELVDAETYLSRIRAAANARSAAKAAFGGDIVIIARTDALQSLGYEAAVSRLKDAIALGADVAFLEGITTREMAAQATKDLAPTPVLLNNVGGGVTPHFTVEEAKQAGFKIIIYPGLALGPVYIGVSAAAKELKETGDIKKSLEKEKAIGFGPKQVFEVCGLKEAMEFDIAAGGKMYGNGV